MLKIKLSKDLEKEYYTINKAYSTIHDEWKKYNGKIIPENKEFAQRIIKFIIQVINYVVDNYERLNIKEYQEFLAYYDFAFFYGPSGDDWNYLSFDERLDGEPVNEFCWELKDDDLKITKEKLKKYDQSILKFFLCLMCQNKNAVAFNKNVTLSPTANITKI